MREFATTGSEIFESAEDDALGMDACVSGRPGWSRNQLILGGHEKIEEEQNGFSLKSGTSSQETNDAEKNRNHLWDGEHLSAGSG